MNQKWIQQGKETVKGWNNRDLMMTIVEAPVDTLHLDPKNARLFAVRQQKYGGRELSHSEARIELWELDSVKQLFNGIKQAGGLTEPLYIMPDGLVIEGNERLTSLLQINDLLSEPVEDAHFNPTQREALLSLMKRVPARVLPEDITATEVAQMLAGMHLGAKDPWDAVNQAKHIHMLHNQHGVTAEELTHMLRKSKPWIYQRLKAYEMASEYFNLHDNWGSTSDFSYFEELYKKKGAMKKLGFDIDVQEDRHQFMSWVASKEIPRALDVRKLPKILAVDYLRDLLEAGEGKQAFSELSRYDASESSPRFAAIKRVNQQLQKMTFEDYQLIHDSEAHRELLTETIMRLRRVVDTVQRMFMDDEDGHAVWDE